MIYFQSGSETSDIGSGELKEGLQAALSQLGAKNKVLALPPDGTRLHSRAGELTRFAFEHYGAALTDIMPALGTHVPMNEEQVERMFGEVPFSLFRPHNWREDLVTLGEVPAEFMRDISEGKLDYSWPAQVNRLLREGGHDLILSIGQVVPHEVAGMANYNKNIFVGTGGADGINKSHFLGAVYGMERMMGRADTPVRQLLNYASDHFCSELPPVVYVQTVIGRAEDGSLKVRGLYIGDDQECFLAASELSRKVNMETLDRPLKKVVVHLDPEEFHSTWLGNKSIYRTRMAVADNGELIVLAPAVDKFGEDAGIDALIRKYGYCGTPETLRYVEESEDLRNNLSAAAHLIHGSSEGRFRITYCPAGLTREEVEGVGFVWGDYAEMSARYDVNVLKDGPNVMPDGEEIFFISNPAIGLWACKERMGG